MCYYNIKPNTILISYNTTHSSRNKNRLEDEDKEGEEEEGRTNGRKKYVGRRKRIGRREGNEENKMKCRRGKRIKREGDEEEEGSRSKR